MEGAGVAPSALLSRGAALPKNWGMLEQALKRATVADKVTIEMLFIISSFKCQTNLNNVHPESPAANPNLI
jgi:hypothetical protein